MFAHARMPSFTEPSVYYRQGMERALSPRSPKPLKQYNRGRLSYNAITDVCSICTVTCKSDQDYTSVLMRGEITPGYARR